MTSSFTIQKDISSGRDGRSVTRNSISERNTATDDLSVFHEIYRRLIKYMFQVWLNQMFLIIISYIEHFNTFGFSFLSQYLVK